MPSSSRELWSMKYASLVSISSLLHSAVSKPRHPSLVAGRCPALHRCPITSLIYLHKKATPTPPFWLTVLVRPAHVLSQTLKLCVRETSYRSNDPPVVTTKLSEVRRGLD
jgi:hypothetical protein